MGEGEQPFQCSGGVNGYISPLSFVSQQQKTPASTYNRKTHNWQWTLPLLLQACECACVRRLQV
jgi:hypothetical protein